MGQKVHPQLIITSQRFKLVLRRYPISLMNPHMCKNTAILIKPREKTHACMCIYDVYIYMICSIYDMYMPTAGKPYVRFASFLSIALCLGVGVGWHVNVPRTSYRIYCHVSVGWGWGGVGWGGMLTFLVLRTGYIAMLLKSLGSFTTLHVATLLRSWGGVGGHVNVPRTSYRIYCHVSVGWGWGGVGWGCMLTFLVLRTGYIAMLVWVGVGVGWGGGAC